VKTRSLVTDNNYRAIFNAINDSISIHDIKTGKIIDANKKMCEMFGYTYDEILHLKVGVLSSDEPQYSSEKILELLNEAAKGGLQLFEWKCKDKSGWIFWVEVKLNPFTIGDRKCMLAIIRNINEHKQMEKTLWDLENKYNSLFEATGTAATIVEEDTTISMANIGFEKLSGFSKIEVEGKKSWTEFIPEEYLEKMKKYHYLRRVDPNSVPKTYESKFIDRDGNVRDVLLNVSMITGTKRSVCSILDITEQKRSWKKLLAYQDQLRYLASRLSLTEERERRLIATELHDTIGHSLAICKIKLEALQEKESSLDFSKHLKEIHNLIEKMINDARSLTFQLSLPILYELGLESALEWLIEQMQEQHGIMSEFEDDGKVKLLEDDIRVILFQAVRELLVNIAKHSHASKAKIVTKRDDESILIEVKDNGIGFDTSQLHLNVSKNFGFGIFNIRERLNHIGGYFDVVSEPGCGTCITMKAPLKSNERTKKEKVL